MIYFLYFLALLVAYGTLWLSLPTWLDVLLFGAIVAVGTMGMFIGGIVIWAGGAGGALFITSLLLLLSRARRLLEAILDTTWTPDGM